MCLTLATATTIIDHHPGRGYTRTWHHACRLSPGDLWRPDPNGRPRTVTEVHRTRDRANLPDLVDQYAQAFSYRSDELVPTAVPDPFTAFITTTHHRPSRQPHRRNRSRRDTDEERDN
jgi:hypothetical protein